MKRSFKKLPNCIKTHLNFLNIIALLLATFLIFGFFNNSILKIIIWPALIVSFIIEFKEQISNLINREIRGKLPGGYEFQILQEKTYESIRPEDIVKEYESIIQKQKIVISNKNLTEEELIYQNAAKDIIIDFERIFNLIFGSQIDLLFFLGNVKKIGFQKWEIEHYFSLIKSNTTFSNNFYNNWSWEDYINFLIARGLIIVNPDNGHFIITDYGLKFLSYIESMNYKSYKSNEL